jgi:hypothetical protein
VLWIRGTAKRGPDIIGVLNQAPQTCGRSPMADQTASVGYSRLQGLVVQACCEELLAGVSRESPIIWQFPCGSAVPPHVSLNDGLY